MREFERLLEGETMKLSDFGNKKPRYIDVITGLKQEQIAGQYTMPLFGEEIELILNVVHPVEPDPYYVYLKKRSEALELLNGNKIV